MISVLTNVSEKMREAHCLIDFEIERNFILQSWVKEHKLLKNHATLKQIQMINDHWILCYDTHQINIELINHEKVCKSWNIEFHVVNMQEYDMILDYSWLDEIFFFFIKCMQSMTMTLSRCCMYAKLHVIWSKLLLYIFSLINHIDSLHIQALSLKLSQSYFRFSSFLCTLRILLFRF